MCWTQGVAPAPGDLPPGMPLVLHVNAPMLPAALLRLPRALLRGRRIIGYWAWELPVAPPDWQHAVACVHEIWTPSRFSAGALAGVGAGACQGRAAPRRLQPAGALRPRPRRFRAAGGAVIVLVSFSLASSFARKNPPGGRSPPSGRRSATAPTGCCCSRSCTPGHAPADLRLIERAMAGACNMRIEARTLPAADSHALTRCCDIVLSLHRSEGFGLVPAEAMCLGRAIVATDWSATSEFLDAGCAVPIPCSLVPADDPRGVFMAPARSGPSGCAGGGGGAAGACR